MDKDTALRTLKDGFKRMANSEEFQRFLEVRSKFHQYSFRNTILIAMQRRGATAVAGFNAWRKLDRFVMKGEKGLAILAPLVYKRKDKITGEESKGLRGFRVVHVFDVSQTDGKPLPEPPCERLTGDDGEEIYHAMKAYALGKGWTWEDECTSFPDDRNGDCNSLEKIIRIRAGLSMMQRAKTSIHEVAHSIMHGAPDMRVMARGSKEIEAESVAFLVLASVGLRSDSYSFGYVASWADGDFKMLEQSLSRIDKATAELAKVLTELESVAV